MISYIIVINIMLYNRIIISITIIVTISYNQEKVVNILEKIITCNIIMVC